MIVNIFLWNSSKVSVILFYAVLGEKVKILLLTKTVSTHTKLLYYQRAGLRFNVSSSTSNINPLSTKYRRQKTANHRPLGSRLRSQSGKAKAEVSIVTTSPTRPQATAHSFSESFITMNNYTIDCPVQEQNADFFRGNNPFIFLVRYREAGTKT